MDVLTPAGIKTLEDEERAKQIFECHYPSFKYIHTPKDQPSDIDAILIDQNRVRGVIETKCRYDVTLEEFNTKYKASWLITFDKVLKAKALADGLRVPLYGFLYLKQSDVLMVTKIYSDGAFLRKIFIDNTLTQKTVNGGQIVRTNAYIDMAGVNVYKFQDKNRGFQ